MTIRTPDDEIERAGYFLPPFTEGWTYHGATYPGHSPFSVDWNRRSPSGAWMDDTGDPVLAIAPGTVAEVDKADGLVLVNHAGGYRSEYRHMTGIGVRVGQKVLRSERLGSIGNVAGSGASFGAHLHHVHWKRDPGKPWRRIRMAFADEPVRTSVADSDTRPEGWTPPAPVVLQGPPARATWESAYRESSKALERSEATREEWRAKASLLRDERDQARSDLTSAVAELAKANARIVELEARPPADCGSVESELAAATARIEAARLALGLVLHLGPAVGGDLVRGGTA